MPDSIPLREASDLKPGEMKRVMVDGQRVLLANVDGAFCALKDECGHQKAALSKGTLQGDVIECPLHFARFDVRTGRALSGPDFGRLQIPGIENLGPEFMAMMQRTGEIIGDVECGNVTPYRVEVAGENLVFHPVSPSPQA